MSSINLFPASTFFFWLFSWARQWSEQYFLSLRPKMVSPQTRQAEEGFSITNCIKANKTDSLEFKEDQHKTAI